jgi:hypothetical protein
MCAGLRSVWAGCVCAEGRWTDGAASIISARAIWPRPSPVTGIQVAWQSLGLRAKRVLSRGTWIDPLRAGAACPTAVAVGRSSRPARRTSSASRSRRPCESDSQVGRAGYLLALTGRPGSVMLRTARPGVLLGAAWRRCRARDSREGIECGEGKGGGGKEVTKGAGGGGGRGGFSKLDFQSERATRTQNSASSGSRGQKK